MKRNINIWFCSRLQNCWIIDGILVKTIFSNIIIAFYIIWRVSIVYNSTSEIFDAILFKPKINGLEKAIKYSLLAKF